MLLSTKDTVKAAGFNIWATGDHDQKGAEVDIVAVQGLGAHSYYTWVKKPDAVKGKKTGKLSLSSDTAQTATEIAEIMWLRDLLPKSVCNARIASYSYESDWRHDVKTNLRNCGEQLLNVLHQSRAGDQERQRPLIMVGHSLGGLVIKQALVLANHGENFKDIRLATSGIIFMGTPENGIWLARATQNDTTLLESLKRDSSTLHEIAQDFEAGYSNVDIVCFYEQKYGPAHIQFVDYKSASLNSKRRIPLNTDHSGLNKYLGSEDENFLLVQAEICRMAKLAPRTIKERHSSYNTATGKDTFCIDFSLKGIPMLREFVGRNAELKRLAQLMISSATDRVRRKVCLIHGISGVGKTELAVEFVLQYREHFSAIFWIAGSTKRKLRRSIVDLARRLPQNQISEKAQSVLKCNNNDLDAAIVDVLKWFSKPLNDKWLLIFDNVDRDFTLQSNDCEAFDIKEYFPDADQGSIIITSQLASTWRLAENDMKLEPFDELDGEILFKSIIGQDLEDLSKLVNLLQGLPLAINQAGSYMRETGTNAFEYIELYNKTWGELMIQQHDLEAQEALPCSILTTWTLSFKHLEEKFEEAANLLTLWAFLDSQDIWYELFLPVLEHKVAHKLPGWFYRCIGLKLRFKKCTRFLIQYSFVNANLNTSSFSVHSVLHRWCFHNSDKRKADMTWLAVLIVAFSAPQSDAPDYSLLQRRLLPHCDRISVLINQNILRGVNGQLNTFLGTACHDLGKLYLDQGKLVQAKAMYLRALAKKEKAWGLDHISTLDTVNNLGTLYYAQGKMAKAEAMYFRGLAGLEQACGPEHPSTLDTLNKLGSLYSDQSRKAEAETMYLRALAGLEKACGPEHISTLGTMDNLAHLYLEQGKTAEAETMYLRVLAGKENTYGPDHTFTLDAVDDLGSLYSNQGKMAQAEAMYLRALAGKEKAWGPKHASTLVTVHNLGKLYSGQGKMAKAEAMHLQALAEHEKDLGSEHTASTANTENTLRFMSSAQDKMAKAEVMYVRALAGFENTYGPEHISTLGEMESLGIVYSAQGKMAEAEDMYLRALAGLEKVWGPEHKSTLATANVLARLYSDLGKTAEAEAMYVRVLAGSENTLGPEHTDTLDAVDNLGTLYSNLGKMVEAEAMYLRALAGKERVWGREHPSTLGTVNNLAVLYSGQGKMAEAEVMYLRALAGLEKTWGPEHTSILALRSTCTSRLRDGH